MRRTTSGVVLFRVARACVLVLLLATLAGCGSSDGFTSPVPPAMIASIIEYFRSSRGWYFKKTKKSEKETLSRTYRHMGFFVHRRAAWIGEDQGWITHAYEQNLRDRVGNELDQVIAYVAGKLGNEDNRGPLWGGTDPTSPNHLDLADVARTHTSMTSAPKGRRSQYLERRRKRVEAIAYRATALHDELWTPPLDQLTATLKTAELDLLLDRRLRSVERLDFEIASAAALGKRNAWQLADADGPWVDGFRVRYIEYPRVAPTKFFVPVLGAANIAEPDDPDFDAGKDWKWSQSKRRLEYNVGPRPAAHFPPPIVEDITKHEDYQLLFTPPTRTAAEVIDLMFTPSTDFWGRSWIWCDHALSALHIEALRFGLKRRNGNDSDFNNLVSPLAHGYIRLGAFVDGGDQGHLLADDDGPYFANLDVTGANHDRGGLKVPDLEIGDHLIFWNSYIYGRLDAGDWRLENTLVMDIDSDPARGSLHLREMELQGHGTALTKYAKYVAEIAQQLDEVLDDMREKIDRAYAADPTVEWLKWGKVHQRLVRWSPYETFPGRGAWWVRIGLIDSDRIGPHWPTIEAALKGMPGTYRDLLPADRGAGYVMAPTTTPIEIPSVYFPLWAPKQGWRQYFEKRRLNASYRRPVLTETVKTTGDMMPGLYEYGQDKPFAVVRPKVG